MIEMICLEVNNIANTSTYTAGARKQTSHRSAIMREDLFCNDTPTDQHQISFIPIASSILKASTAIMRAKQTRKLRFSMGLLFQTRNILERTRYFESC